MYVHTVAGFSGKRLGHEGCRASVFNGFVFDDVFGCHRVVGQLQHVTELNFDLHLSAAAYFGMVILDVDPPFAHDEAHAASEITAHIHGHAGVIACAVGELVAFIIVFRAGSPVGLACVNVKAVFLSAHVVAHLVKNVELVFRPDEHLIGNTGFLHVVERADRNVSGILVEGTILGKIDDLYISDHGECRDLGIAVDHSGIENRREDHVRVFDRCIAVVGTVKSDPVYHCVFGETLRRDAQVAPSAVDVGEFEIDDLDVFAFDEVKNILQCFTHN